MFDKAQYGFILYLIFYIDEMSKIVITQVKVNILCYTQMHDFNDISLDLTLPRPGLVASPRSHCILWTGASVATVRCGGRNRKKKAQRKNMLQTWKLTENLF